MDAGIFDQHNAHNGQRCGNIQVLCGGLETNDADQVGAGNVQCNRDQVRHILFAGFAQQIFEEVIHGYHSGFQDGLALADMIDLEIACEQNRNDHQKRHDAPAYRDGFRDVDAAKNGKGKRRINVKLLF